MPQLDALSEPIHILLVRDDPVGSLHLRLAIAMAPIRTVVHGIEKTVSAVRSLTRSIRGGSRAPQLILLECNLKDAASQEILSLARKSPEIARAALVVLGDGDDPEQESKASVLGATGFIARPERASDLPRLARDLGRVWTSVQAMAS
jgi:DNA-binding NarL/FixJ family response regulator